MDGKLYVTDRAEEDPTKSASGLFRIDGPNRVRRMVGNADKPAAKDASLAVDSFIEGPRGIAFRPDGSYILCGHKDGNIWFIDMMGMIHTYLQGSGKKDVFAISDGLHPPLTGMNYFSQPRAVTLACDSTSLSRRKQLSLGHCRICRGFRTKPLRIYPAIWRAIRRGHCR